MAPAGHIRKIYEKRNDPSFLEDGKIFPDQSTLDKLGLKVSKCGLLIPSAMSEVGIPDYDFSDEKEVPIFVMPTTKPPQVEKASTLEPCSQVETEKAATEPATPAGAQATEQSTPVATPTGPKGPVPPSIDTPEPGSAVPINQDPNAQDASVRFEKFFREYIDIPSDESDLELEELFPSFLRCQLWKLLHLPQSRNQLKMILVCQSPSRLQLSQVSRRFL